MTMTRSFSLTLPTAAVVPKVREREREQEKNGWRRSRVSRLRHHCFCLTFHCFFLSLRWSFLLFLHRYGLLYFFPFSSLRVHVFFFSLHLLILATVAVAIAPPLRQLWFFSRLIISGRNAINELTRWRVGRCVTLVVCVFGEGTGPTERDEEKKCEKNAEKLTNW